MRKTINFLFGAAVTAAFIALGLTAFLPSYLRLAETLYELGLSIAFYFRTMFGIECDMPQFGSTAALPDICLMPSDSAGFWAECKRFFALLVDKGNFLGWLSCAGEALSMLMQAITVMTFFTVALVAVMKKLYGQTNNKRNKDTLPLRAFKAFSRITYEPIKSFTLWLVRYVSEHRRLVWLWAAVWAANLNLVSAMVALIAFAFRFFVTFDFSMPYPALRNLMTDLAVFFRSVPLWLGLIFALYLFLRWRRKIALRRLRRFEARNCGFINDLPIVTMTCGSMGKKKTTAITDMALSQEVMFRQKALSILQNNDMKFPHFPWICFEDELCACMEHHTVYSLASVKAWVEKKRERYMRHGNAKLQLYGYDVKRYGFTYDDALKTSTLFDVMETYAQAYFIYTVESSLILSNYSIRTDNEFVSEGNFPLWLTDFFTAKSGESERHSHILDFDVLRLGRKVLENNPRAGSFEFGVVAISEIGKERGNNLELQEKKKSDGETNQKNDLFNAWLKMCRHSATVDNFPFIKIFTDEQRPESWGADARDLCDILRIEDAGERRLALPFYTIEEMLSEWAFGRFISLYYDFRFRRGDNTLLVHILKSITARIWHRHVRIYDRYGYSVLTVTVERGTMDGKKARKKYFLMDRKIYSRRFSTDCFSDYFNDLAKRSKVGLNDYLEYAAERASVAELKEQNSYFVNALYKEE